LTSQYINGSIRSVYINLANLHYHKIILKNQY